jgi:hypothetical protein
MAAKSKLRFSLRFGLSETSLGHRHGSGLSLYPPALLLPSSCPPVVVLMFDIVFTFITWVLFQFYFFYMLLNTLLLILFLILSCLNGHVDALFYSKVPTCM